MPAVAHGLSASQPAIAVQVALPLVDRPMLAAGAWFSNTLCVTRDGRACVSRVVGDLDHADACRAHQALAGELLAWLGEKPRAIAHDLHPDFHSSRHAAVLAARFDVPLIGVQHHHAHIAAVAAEHGHAGPLLGLALDGVGLGTDGAAWGGELLRVDGSRFRRLGHLQSLPLPGGDRAAREPWRMAAAALHVLGRNDEIPRRFPQQAGAATVAAMLRRGLHCPATSSMGRHFDAAAGLLGVCEVMAYEAQAAMRLEQLAAAHGPAVPLAGGYAIDGHGVLDLRPLLAELADCDDAGLGAALFHATVADGLAQWVARAAETQGIRTVALGGGCFLNRILPDTLRPALAAQGLEVLGACRLPPGDSAISLGQAWVALHRLLEEGH